MWRQERDLEAMTVETVSSAIRFSGLLTDDVKQDCRELYGRWSWKLSDPQMSKNRLHRSGYLLWRLSPLLILAFLVWRDPSRGLMAVLIGVGGGATLLLPILVLLPKVFSGMWWRQIYAGFNGTVAGEVSAKWLRWTEDGGVFSWSDFVAAKLNKRAMLLYVTKADALPIHRSMFAGDEDWQQVCEWLMGAGVPVRRFEHKTR